MKKLVAIPVFNEQRYVRGVLERVLQHTDDVLVVDDGSTDDTPKIVGELGVNVIRRLGNRGYGRSLRDAFNWAIAEKYDWIVTMDCDEQHEPEALPLFFRSASTTDLDVISGSRYLLPASDSAPPERRAINLSITAEINARLGLRLTDSFCGFKAHRVSSLRELDLTEDGYAFPMQFWVQAVARGLRVGELPVKLIYNDPNRTFGGDLDNAANRFAHYRRVLHDEIFAHASVLPRVAMAGLRPSKCGSSGGTKADRASEWHSRMSAPGATAKRGVGACNGYCPA
ncbi:MAG: glycosyltransferase family 2 protein [Planctomycetota bacterium]|nr:glycosyltransferase family 2 protein [Planctomycetota bacterium]